MYGENHKNKRKENRHIEKTSGGMSVVGITKNEATGISGH